MSKEDIFAEEVARRRLDIQGLTDTLPDINAAIEQNSDLDETYKGTQQEFKDELDCIYKETRHYTGKWPIVYTNAQTERYPYIKETDDLCNPYYRISEIEAGNNDGLAPQYSEPTRTGAAAINRDRNYTREDTLRSTALAALQAYPDRSGETGEFTCVGSPTEMETDQMTCEMNGGVWTPPNYAPGTTAPEKLESALNPWRAAIVQLKADLCTSQVEDMGGVADTLLQNIIDEIDIILAELPSPPTYPDQTPDASYCDNIPPPTYSDQASCELAGFNWYSTLQDAIDATVDYINNSMPNDIDTRNSPLASKATTIEQKHFGIIGLRLHQVNGSFTKVNQLKGQKKDIFSLIDDHKKSIANINVLRVNNS